MKEAQLVFHPCVYIDVEIPDDFDVEKVNGMSDQELYEKYYEQITDFGAWDIAGYDDIEVVVL